MQDDENIDQNMFLHSSFRIRTANSKVADPLMLDVHVIHGHMRKHAEYANLRN